MKQLCNMKVGVLVLILVGLATASSSATFFTHEADTSPPLYPQFATGLPASSSDVVAAYEQLKIAQKSGDKATRAQALKIIGRYGPGRVGSFCAPVRVAHLQIMLKSRYTYQSVTRQECEIWMKNKRMSSQQWYSAIKVERYKITNSRLKVLVESMEKEADLLERFNRAKKKLKKLGVDKF